MEIIKEFLLNLPLLGRIIAFIIGLVIWGWFLFFYPTSKDRIPAKGTTGDKSPGVVYGDYVVGDKVYGDKNNLSDEKSYVISESIVKGVLPVLAIKNLPSVQAPGRKIDRKEYALYLILEISANDHSLNLTHIILEGELFLNHYEYSLKKENIVETSPQISKEIQEKRPYYKIKWITSSPIPSKFEKNQIALTLFTLKELDVNQIRSFVSKDDDFLGNYVGYKTLGQIPKWESTHPNIQEFLETKVENNKPYYSGIREDFMNGNIKWYLNVGGEKILIPSEKIKPVKVEYLSQEDDFIKKSLESIYYREWY